MMLRFTAIALACFCFNVLKAQEMKYYQEEHRPQFHFTPEKAWMNDPNGMVYFDGEYHLFYQYYPYATVWGPMHWGHAISKDMVHWEHLPIGLYPDSLGFIFSGSAVVDWKNSSGFGDGKQPPLVAIYTYHNMVGEKTGRTDYQSQGIAYSLDKGRTWTKHVGNPVLPNQGIRDFRDPKVIWHEASKQWVMVLAVKDRIQLYHSSDLKKWTFASEFGKDSAPQLGVWECPDLFPLKVKDSQEIKWVMIVSHGGGGPNGGSCTRYFVGDFDGEKFNSDDPVEQINWLDYGTDNYAGVTWSDVPKLDGRRLFIGWMSNWQYAKSVPTKEWRSAMTIPRTLTLRQTKQGLKLYSAPVKELELLRHKTQQLNFEKIAGVQNISGIHSSLLEANVTFDLSKTDSKAFGIQLSNTKGEYVRISYDKAAQLIIVDRSKAGKINFSNAFPELHYIPMEHVQNTMKWQVFFDKSSLELFVNEGAISHTDTFFPNEDFNQLSLFAFDGLATLKQGEIHMLKRIWKD